LRVGELPAAGDETDARTEIGDERFLGHGSARAKRISVQKNVACDSAAIDCAEREQTEVAVECDPRIEIIGGRSAHAARTRELHAEITRQIETETDGAASVCIGLNIADTDAGVRNEIRSKGMEE